MVQWSSFTNSRYLTLAATAVTAIAASVYFTMKKKKKVYELVGEVSGLYCYPVKSCAGIKGDVAFCSSTGLVVSGVKDRHFLIVRSNGDFITQRQISKMASIKTSVDGQDLILDADGMASLKVPLSPKLDESKIILCRIFQSTLDAQDCGEEASSWISSVLGEEGLKLVVFIPGVSKRQSVAKNSLAKDQIAFPDKSPYHLATEESLADLNSRIEKSPNGKITMSNFRPTIIIKGAKKPWDEDNWSHLKIGGSVEMRVLAPCDRCLLTTVDPNKSERREDGEPLKTLRKFRIVTEVSSTAPLFGIFAAVDTENSIKIGDPVYAVRQTTVMVQWSSLTLAATAVTAIAASVYFTMKKKKKVYELVGEVSGLYCYPVKSCAGIKGDVAFCSSTGLVVSGVKDRHFLIIRPNGDFITQRQISKMASIKTSVDGQVLILDADGMASLKVPLSPKLDKSKIIQCRIWVSTLDAQDCGEEASSWISSVLGEEGLKLVVFIPGVSKRQSIAKNTLAKDKVEFPDQSAYLVATEESLADLNSRIEKSPDGEVTMRNFRPNIVIKGTKKPWDEDNWSFLKIGESIEMRVPAPCTRCVMTTVDPDKYERRSDEQPLKTLKRFRIFAQENPSSPLFGVFAAVDSESTIKVGDPVYARQINKWDMADLCFFGQSSFFCSHFLIVDATGDYVTAHQTAQIAGIKSSVDQQELVLEFDNVPELRVPLNHQVDLAKIVPCRLYSTPFEAQDCGPEAGAWLSQVLQMEGLKLLVLPPGLKRRVGRCAQSTVKDQIAFSNRAPYLIATEESLADLNTWISPAPEGEITMRNFRPSIVIKGIEEPWDEDNWTEIMIGNYVYMRVLQHCGRCPLTTVDAEKLQKREDGEPFKTLRRRRLFPSINTTSPLFGVYCGLESGGTIRVGDKVYAVRRSMHSTEVA
ncbi:uncharacterized protein LOC131946229 [Physella acuta]|uniref:uncharacterized protein LOC131946229 n=1 Tax=Physella acuta TaxID=109671 RepID=UPI0027DC7F34|nr:uncharacterized protein LOC131946229 [Physella acuta]